VLILTVAFIKILILNYNLSRQSQMVCHWVNTVLYTLLIMAFTDMQIKIF
jgi:hypothetical protein